jgi:hypothetical protein
MVTENLVMGKKFIPQDNQIGPGPNGAPKGPPAGYRALTSVSPDVGKVAKSLLGNDFGTMIPFTLNGINYMARLEPHYHPPGFKGGPNGWHKGVTVYESSSNAKQPSAKKEDRQKLYDRIDAFLAEFDEI